MNDTTPEMFMLKVTCPDCTRIALLPIRYLNSEFNTVTWMCNGCNHLSTIKYDKDGRIEVSYTGKSSHLDLKPEDKDVKDVSVIIKLKVNCKACTCEQVLNLSDSTELYKWPCKYCNAVNVTRKVHSTSGSVSYLTSQVRDVMETTISDANEAKPFGFSKWATTGGVPPQPPINEAPAPSRDQDAPPKRGFGWVFPLAMEVAGLQIVKGYESYETLLESGNGRFMDLPPELFDAFIYSVAQREDMRRLITLGRALVKAAESVEFSMDESNIKAVEVLNQACLAWSNADNYPEDVTRK